jgi:hypothetical protein
MSSDGTSSNGVSFVVVIEEEQQVPHSPLIPSVDRLVLVECRPPTSRGVLELGEGLIKSLG